MRKVWQKIIKKKKPYGPHTAKYGVVRLFKEEAAVTQQSCVWLISPKLLSCIPEKHRADSPHPVNNTYITLSRTCGKYEENRMHRYTDLKTSGWFSLYVCRFWHPRMPSRNVTAWTVRHRPSEKRSSIKVNNYKATADSCVSKCPSQSFLCSKYAYQIRAHKSNGLKQTRLDVSGKQAAQRFFENSCTSRFMTPGENCVMPRPLHPHRLMSCSPVLLKQGNSFADSHRSTVEWVEIVWPDPDIETARGENPKSAWPQWDMSRILLLCLNIITSELEIG